MSKDKVVSRRRVYQLSRPINVSPEGKKTVFVIKSKRGFLYLCFVHAVNLYKTETLFPQGLLMIPQSSLYMAVRSLSHVP